MRRNKFLAFVIFTILGITFVVCSMTVLHYVWHANAGVKNTLQELKEQRNRMNSIEENKDLVNHIQKSNDGIEAGMIILDATQSKLEAYILILILNGIVLFIIGIYFFRTGLIHNREKK